MLIILLVILAYLVLLYRERAKIVNFRLPSLDVVRKSKIKQTRGAFKLLKANEKKTLDAIKSDIDADKSDETMYLLMQEYEAKVGKRCENIIVLPNLLALQFTESKEDKKPREIRTLNKAREMIDESFDSLMISLGEDD